MFIIGLLTGIGISIAAFYFLLKNIDWLNDDI